ncbi:hypothetical protein EYF80_033727 [Liparis tanakae]|uniref:Uncharacterized protein n=1 Tax=Liparis tanakae TaxID=230148 RepID=A0A4Z2GRT1_9TELE|nr:hypothetical protein EYF80_033727 [Liparis tanakae]
MGSCRFFICKIKKERIHCHLISWFALMDLHRGEMFTNLLGIEFILQQGLVEEVPQLLHSLHVLDVNRVYGTEEGTVPATRDISSSRTKSSANTTSSSQLSERYATPSTSTSSHTDCSTDIWSARDSDRKPAEG